MPRLTGKKTEGLEAIKHYVESAKSWLEKARKEFIAEGENQTHLRKNMGVVVAILEDIIDSLELERVSEEVKKNGQ
mgnify:CR=1 FL=1